MKKNKKGLEMTLSTMVISILVLIVLVVLILIFTGVIGGIFNPGLTNCADKGGTCQESPTCDPGYAKASFAKCRDTTNKITDQTCCINTNVPPPS